MKNGKIRFLTIGLTAFLGAANAATIVVNTADNTDFSAGKTNFVYALTNIADGDTIAFNIPGAGPHFLQTPPNGYPLLVKDRVTVDGYTQPGASPNSNPSTAANNAVIKIVLDSRNGNYRDMEYTLFTLANSSPPIDNTSMATERGGYGFPERAVLGIYRATNVTVRGLAILGTFEESAYGIAVAHDYGLDTAVKDRLAYDAGSSRNCHINGCWIGVNPTNPTVAGLAPMQDGIAFFRHRDISGGPRPELPNEGLIVGVKPGSANPRAEFNVIPWMYYAFAGEGIRTRVSGNFFGVLPDGVTPSGVPPLFGAGMENGRYNDTQPIILGTDSDGVNDAEEGNLFGPLEGGAVFGFYSTGDKLYVIAGNRFGIANDGTRWTNSQTIFDSFANTTKAQFGSDFNGVSDAVEVNVVCQNYPLGTPLPRFFVLSTGTRLSMRGNTLINNALVPFDYADGAGGRLGAFTNYASPFMDTNAAIIPTLNPTSTYPHLVGTFAVGIGSYTTIIIDVYQLDAEGWANGKTIGGTLSWPELTDGWSFTNGFAQGAKYVGSRVVPNTGNFDIDISGMDLGTGAVTVTANYSADAAGTTRGRVHTSDFAMPIYMLPGGVAGVGVSHIVPDMLLWYNTATLSPTNGPVDLVSQAPNLGNWEPYASVLGDSTFLVEHNTFAPDVASQNFVVALQPAGGGAPKLAYAFYSDAGTPFAAAVNLSRQNGNPGRVAGDARYGAVNYLTEAESSLGQLPEFQSPARWGNNPIYTGTARYACAEPFALNPLTLVPTPTAKAWDYVYGPYVTATAPFSSPEVSRTGGRPIGLDNGNFVVMNHDKTRYLFATGDAATFSIIKPDGTEVKSATLAKGQDVWDNMCAYRGGFAIRVHNSLLFYNNAGTLQFSNDVVVATGLAYDTGRGDGTRIAGDIRSPYVYLAGQCPASGSLPYPVMLSVFDSRTGAFVTKAQVSDGDPTIQANDRVMAAVDALNRICVVWAHRPNTINFTVRQVVARVMAFDGSKISYLTHSFYPFVNHDLDGTLLLQTFHPTVAMTPRQICIGARGQVNSTNNPAGGPDTAMETDLYTVISHPAPVAAPRPQMTINKSGATATISWLADAGLFVLQSSPTVAPTAWADVSPQPAITRIGAGDPNDTFLMTVAVGSGNVFYRLLRRW